MERAVKRGMEITVVLVLLVCIYRYNQTGRETGTGQEIWEAPSDMKSVMEQREVSQTAVEELETAQADAERNEEGSDPDTAGQRAVLSQQSSYMSEICGGDQKIFMQTKDIYVDDFGYPVELTVYRNDKGEDIRYQIQLYGETGRSVTDYYLCEHFIYVNEEKEYYSSQMLAENYDDVLYRKTTDWIILEDGIYLLQDNGEMKIEEDAPFYSIEEVKGWIEGVPLDMDAVVEQQEVAEAFNFEGIYDEDVVSDFLDMDREAFEKQYDKNALYEKDILYCTEEAWKYQGEQLDGFSDPKEYFDVDDIWAIRFVKPGLTEPSLNVETDHFEDVRNRITYQCFEDYAVSMYFREKNDVQGKPELELTELSFIKVKFGEHERREIAPRRLYELLESRYYEAREEIEAGEWAVSPEKTKAVCISNGALPKHPSQIFVRYREKAPDLIFRRTWECYFAGWIDEDHFICYNDDGPYLIHLETNQIEDIRKKEDDYDAYGCKYEVIGDQLVAICLGEEQYRWDIVREEGEILISAFQ